MRNSRVALAALSLAALPVLATAADTGALACKTTEECAAQPARPGRGPVQSLKDADARLDKAFNQLLAN